MSDTMNQPRAFEILTAEPVKNRCKPRDWSDHEKSRLVAETRLPGANVSAIARSAGVDPSQLYGWRRKALSSGAVAPAGRMRVDLRPQNDVRELSDDFLSFGACGDAVAPGAIFIGAETGSGTPRPGKSKGSPLKPDEPHFGEPPPEIHRTDNGA